MKDGTLEEIDGLYVLRFERRLSHPVERVWAALTQPDQLVEWLAATEELDLVEGGRMVLRWQNEISAEDIERYEIELPPGRESVSTVAHGTITRLEAPRLLEWENDVFGTLRWELRDDGGDCILVFTDTLPPVEAPMAAQTLAGWHSHLDALEAALAGHPTDWEKWRIDEWAAHRARYAAMLADSLERQEPPLRPPAQPSADSRAG